MHWHIMACPEMLAIVFESYRRNEQWLTRMKQKKRRARPSCHQAYARFANIFLLERLVSLPSYTFWSQASSRSRQRKLKNKNTATKRNKVKLGKRDGKATRSASRAQKISRSNSSRRHKVSSTKRSSGSAKRSGTSSRKSAKTSRKRPSSKTTKTKSNKTKKRKPKSAHAAITEGADEMEVTEEPVIMMDQVCQTANDSRDCG